MTSEVRATAELRLLFDAGVASLDSSLQLLVGALLVRIALFNGRLIKEGSGAVMNRLGSIYVSPTDLWTVQDMAECIVHELTHVLLRLDELRYGHYPPTSAVWKRTPIGRTAILGKFSEPFVIFHSLVVAAEVKKLREERFSSHEGIHGSNRALRDSALSCSRETLERFDVEEHFTSRALELMRAATMLLEGEIPTGRPSW